jgi:hypothetical protein
MLTLLIGFVASLAVYFASIYGFIWAGTRRMEWGARHGVGLSPEPTKPSIGDIWTRHSAEMTVIYGVAFIALVVFDFTIWQRLGFALLGAVTFGSLWVSSSTVTDGLPGTSSGRRLASNCGYWLLSVADWFGYFGVLCFGTSIVIGLF